MDDERFGTCPNCGGWLIYIESQNKVICDTCDYEIEEVY